MRAVLASVAAAAATVVLAGCGGGGPVAQPLPGPAPATLADSATPSGGTGIVPTTAPPGSAASGAAAFAYESGAYPQPSGTPATGLGLGDTCRAFANIVHNPSLDDAVSAAELRSLSTRTSITKLGAAIAGVADQYAKRVTVVNTVKADDQCN